MIDTIGDGLVTRIGDDTLCGGAVMGPGNGPLGCDDIVGDVSGRYIASIFCRVLMD